MNAQRSGAALVAGGGADGWAGGADLFVEVVRYIARYRPVRARWVGPLSPRFERVLARDAGGTEAVDIEWVEGPSPGPTGDGEAAAATELVLVVCTSRVPTTPPTPVAHRSVPPIVAFETAALGPAAVAVAFPDTGALAEAAIAALEEFDRHTPGEPAS